MRPPRDSAPTLPPASPGKIQVVGGWADVGQYIEARGTARVRLRFHVLAVATGFYSRVTSVLAQITL